MTGENYIKLDVRTAIKNAQILFLYGKNKTNVITPKKGQNWSKFIKEGFKTGEFNKLVIYHKGTLNRTTIGVPNAI